MGTRPRPPRLAFVPLLALPAAVLSTACGEGGPATTDFAGTVDTLANGALHTQSPAQGLWSPEERWRLEEELRVGSREGDGPDVFGGIGDIEVDEQGRLWVLDSQAAEVRVFGPDGTRVRTLGRKGGGPGELQSPLELRWGPDGHLWVADARNRRYEVFDTAGEHVKGVPFRGTSFGMTARFDSAGRIVDHETVPGEDGGRTVVIVRDPGRDMAAVDTFPVLEVPPGETVEVTGSAGDYTFVTRFPIPFTHQPAARLQSGAFWLTWPGSGEYRYARVTLEGDTVQIVERAYEPVSVGEEERAAALRRGVQGRQVEFPESRVPRVRPPFSGVHPAPDGHDWVRRVVGRDSVALDVFDPRGRYMGEVESAVDLSRFTLHAVTDEALYGAWEDETGVPHVVRLGIRKGGEGG